MQTFEMDGLAVDGLADRARSPGRVVALAIRQALQSRDGLLERLPVGICTCDRSGMLIQYNRRAAELWGRTPLLGSAEYRYCGAYRTYRPSGEALPLAEAPMVEVLQSGKPVRDREVVFERLDGTRVSVLANLDPLLGAAGAIIGGVNCFQDITELKQAQDMLSERERRSRELLDALPAAVYTTDAAGRITFYNRAAEALWGCRPELGSMFCGSWRLYHPDGTPMAHEECPMAQALQEKRAIRGVEAMAERPDGTRVPFIPYPTPLYNASGALVGAVNMLVDITERKRGEAQQKALLDELNHRVKNTLATVQSLAAHTFRGAGVARNAREAFDHRLFALSRIHDQLTRERWASADLKLMIDDIFAPYGSDSGHRIRLDGGSVRVEPQAALTLAMVLHELATNAAKYGCLSGSDGTLTLSWAKTSGDDQGRRVRIVWQETGGPPVRPPEHQGFGMRLMERGIRQGLKGTLEIGFEPPGVCCILEIPLPSSGGA